MRIVYEDPHAPKGAEYEVDPEVGAREALVSALGRVHDAQVVRLSEAGAWTTVDGRPYVEVRAEDVARAFHEAYERLAPEHGYETRGASSGPWEEVPEDNRRLMVAAARDLLERGVVS